MKKHISILTTSFLFLLILGLSCSDGESDPTAQELAFEKLAGNWDISQGGSIIIDGHDASPNFVGFALSFTDGGYNTTNAGDLFSATGTWDWADEEARMINLDDSKLVTIVSLTESEFVFSFSFNGTGGVANSSDGIAGSYTITVSKP